MRVPSTVRKFAPSVGAFVLVCAGALMLLPQNDASKASSDVTVVIVTRALPEGTPSADVRDSLATRTIPAEAAVQGALTSVAQVPDGVLAVPPAEGQQLTPCRSPPRGSPPSGTASSPCPCVSTRSAGRAPRRSPVTGLTSTG